jgi:hypothetical protein
MGVVDLVVVAENNAQVAALAVLLYRRENLGGRTIILINDHNLNARRNLG